jgi:hypothetical protein
VSAEHADRAGRLERVRDPDPGRSGTFRLRRVLNVRSYALLTDAGRGDRGWPAFSLKEKGHATSASSLRVV